MREEELDMFGIGIPELILILIVGLIVFGPGKLPEVGRAVGKGLREFRKASSALQSALEEPPAGGAAASPAPAQSASASSAPAGDTAKTASPTDGAGDAGTRAEPTGEATAAGANPPAYEPPTQESVRRQLQGKG